MVFKSRSDRSTVNRRLKDGEECGHENMKTSGLSHSSLLPVLYKCYISVSYYPYPYFLFVPKSLWSFSQAFFSVPSSERVAVGSRVA